MANNHQGSVEHGFRIINAAADITRRHQIRGAVKLQFRDLDTFIHPDHRDSKNNKHIPRFLSTRLSEDEFARLVEETKKNNLITICTPFDETSVDKIERLGIELIKIGSCSAQDWPLLEKVAQSGKPVICSTGGLTIKEVDRIVTFFQHRGVLFALMHCVAIYPTPNDKFHLNQIEIMKNRYPGVTIGFSTHEDPINTNVIMMAYAKGARIFEKHVGVPADGISLNAYSASPEQTEAWVMAYKDALSACGHNQEREISEKEKSDLKSLMRGVFAKRDIKADDIIKREDVFFAMPLQENQLSSGFWKNNLIADRDYKINESLSALLNSSKKTPKDIIYSTIHEIKGMLNESKIPLGHDFSVELSHHYGIEKFHEIGCTIIECVNREYAKKLIIQLPGQWNPIHYHIKKDETFHILRGVVEVEIEGNKKVLHSGDTLWIPRGVWHGFGTESGAIIEEISTASQNDDSFYVDRKIAKMPREERKTRLLNWGRHQFD